MENAPNKEDNKKITGDDLSKADLKKRIIELYDSGQTMMDISKSVNRSKIYVSNVIHEFYDENEIKVRQYDKLRGKAKLDFSRYRSSTGIYRVSYVENKRSGNDYWSYQYYDDGRLKRIVSVNLYKLKTVVTEKGLDWFEFTEEAKEMVLKDKENFDESSLERTNKTGFYRVTKRKTNTKQGYTWAYSFKENNHLYFVSSISISKLKEKVLSNGWEWEELTEEATRLVEEDSKKRI